MMDPVLGPINSYERGGPAALSPYNQKIRVDKKMALISTEELQERQQEVIESHKSKLVTPTDCLSHVGSPSSNGDATSYLGPSMNIEQGSLFSSNL